MKTLLDEATDPWGVRVERVEVKDVRLPVQLQRAMAAEAEAAREARAKVIAAEGEHKASSALKEAAHVIEESPHALQVAQSHILLEKQTQAKNNNEKWFSFSAPLSSDSELDISRTQLHDNFPNANQYRQHELKPKYMRYEYCNIAMPMYCHLLEFTCIVNLTVGPCSV